MSKPGPGEVWKVKIFHRTYWRSTTIKLIDVNPHRNGFGWLYYTKLGGYHWSESTECRLDSHIKFVELLSSS